MRSSSTRYWVIIVALILVIAGLLVRRQSLELTAEQKALQTTDEELALTRKNLAAAREKVAVADQARKAAEAKLAAAGGGGADGAQKTKKKGTVRMSDWVRDHPEFAKVREVTARRNMINQYGGALSRLNLSPDQLEKVKSLLTERDLAEGDSRNAAADKGLDPNGSEAHKAGSLARDEIDSELKTLLGSDQATALQAIPEYKYKTDNVGAAMADVGAPLTTDQSYALTQAMVKVAQASPQTAGDANKAFREADPQTGLSKMDLSVLDQAGAFLSAPQVEALRASLAEENRRQSMYSQVFKTANSIRDD